MGAGLTDTAPCGDVLALQEALQIAHLQGGDAVARQRPRGEHPARRTHGAAAAPQAAAAVVALALAARSLAPEYAELHGAAFARHLTAMAPAYYHLAYSTLHLHRHVNLSRAHCESRNCILFVIRMVFGNAFIFL